MRRGAFLLALVLGSGAFGRLRGQEFKVDLFSKQPALALVLHAGSSSLRICAIPDGPPCLVLKPQRQVRCSGSKRGVHCSSPEATRQFRRASASSTSPFHLQAASGTAGQGGAPREITVHALEIIPGGDGLRAVATIDLETYIAGVVAGEGATLKSPSALESIAVVARTWALRRRGRHRQERFDYCALTHCQFFRLPVESRGKEPAAPAEAVRKTEGLVLKYHGRLIDPYYSANCGGITEAAGALWPEGAQPYLRSNTDPYCLGDEQSSWQTTLALEQVRMVLRGRLGLPIRSSLQELRIESKTGSGRARALQTISNASWQIDANEFRYAVNRQLGWHTLKSNLYGIERQGDSLVFTGRGLGHGVGLCQAGAEQMGRMGISYPRILAHYFPSTTVVPLESESSEQVLSSEHFELIFPPDQQAWADETLRTLEALRRALGSRAQVLRDKIRAQTWNTTAEFMRATGQPGWVAASSGETIALQPLRTLKRKGILHSTLRHELTHLVVHRLRAAKIPRWYEEGMVLYLTGEHINEGPTAGDLGRNLEESIARPRSEAEMKAAYARALEQVRELARRRGESALWQVLQHPSAEDLRWLRGLR